MLQFIFTKPYANITKTRRACFLFKAFLRRPEIIIFNIIIKLEVRHKN